MAKAKKKTKAKAKPKTKSKAKAKPKAKPKARPKAKPKAKTKSRAGNGIPITVTPLMCSDFTANTGDIVAWQQIPAAGCQVTKGTTAWPFNVPHPINLTPVSNTQIKIAVGQGVYEIVVGCCSNQGLKSVTVP
ncbi:MAG TPA: hypothetical protein VNX26_01545 [Candidatus Acidoferrum sp.]|jgi:hypothetical protein|nr:hypothetical protein [Candidatus Acidoferrum sp.]